MKKSKTIINNTMDDSFFGFDTSIPTDEDGSGGRIAEPSEEEYDALNDETFGSAINGDWEEVHENLVRYGTDKSQAVKEDDRQIGELSCHDGRDRNRAQNLSASSSGFSTPAFLGANMRKINHIADSDLEINLSSMKLDDVDIDFDDNDSSGANGIIDKINLDPAVWASHPVKQTNNFPNGFLSNQQSLFHPQHQSYSADKSEQNSYLDMSSPQLMYQYPKISTLEDIERNIIITQTLQKQHQQQNNFRDNKLIQESQQKQHITPPNALQKQHQQLFANQNAMQSKGGPPGFITSSQGTSSRPNLNFGNNSVQHAPNNVMQPQNSAPPVGSGNRLPPGFPIYPPGLAMNSQTPHFPPHPLLNQHGAPHFSIGNHRSMQNVHLPTALNNFAMHPTFNAMRAAPANFHPAALMPPMIQSRVQPHPLHAANNLLNQQPSSMHNIFNMRLVQEIQQNHPLLQNIAIPRMQQQQPQMQMRSNSSVNGSNISKQQHSRWNDGNSSVGNLPQDEFDEYANLMSIRDKHWLIGIQLSQLNTDTPYIDDYYYTVYRERKALQNGDIGLSKAHKDNQLNHPLTQPRGHAQLILVQLGNKNGTRNGQNRERRNSESATTSNSSCQNNIQDQKLPYIFTPLKFENSLGKLQYGSVTAPRKIIDADIMNSDSNTNGSAPQTNSGLIASQSQCKLVTMGISGSVLNTVKEVTATNPRKSRHILLHIEILYHNLLKLEDLENPIAISTIIMKKKKETERIAALEQLEYANKTPEERACEANNPQSTNPALKNKFNYEIEPKAVLINKLVKGLTYEKITAMMNIRKGKILLRRIMPFIEDQNIRWNVWVGVFCSLQNVIKKDREDTDGVLYSLYPEFKKQIKSANFDIIVTISSSLTANDKKLNGLICTRFGILSLVCLVLQSEHIYVHNSDETLNDENKEKWRKFLAQVASALNRTIQNQTISAAFELDSIHPMMNHFSRFKDLKLDALLALITEAKQQIK